MVPTCSPSYLGDWGRGIAWIQEAEIAVNLDHATTLQPGNRARFCLKKKIEDDLCHLTAYNLVASSSLMESKTECTWFCDWEILKPKWLYADHYAFIQVFTMHQICLGLCTGCWDYPTECTVSALYEFSPVKGQAGKQICTVSTLSGLLDALIRMHTEHKANTGSSAWPFLQVRVLKLE